MVPQPHPSRPPPFQCLRASTVLPVLFPMLGDRLRSPDWRIRFAAVSAVGCVAECVPQDVDTDYNAIMDQLLPGAQVTGTCPHMRVCVCVCVCECA
jgi:hypothetical protein